MHQGTKPQGITDLHLHHLQDTTTITTAILVMVITTTIIIVYGTRGDIIAMVVTTIGLSVIVITVIDISTVCWAITFTVALTVRLD